MATNSANVQKVSKYLKKKLELLLVPPKNNHKAKCINLVVLLLCIGQNILTNHLQYYKPKFKKLLVQKKYLALWNDVKV